ncbi:MAG: hypothetical protein HY908_25455 [Myxococcales bacterium]|nr:hypothetical protein [Myxococcales bacterium]
MLVAGWCEILYPGETTWRWCRTRRVYRKKRLCGLVTGLNIPLTRYTYDWDPVRTDGPGGEAARLATGPTPSVQRRAPPPPAP